MPVRYFSGVGLSFAAGTILAADPNGTVWGQLSTTIDTPTFSVVAGADAGGGVSITSAGVLKATATPLSAGAYTFTARAANATSGDAIEKKFAFTVISSSSTAGQPIGLLLLLTKAS
jgi:hypothetical protein